MICIHNQESISRSFHISVLPKLHSKISHSQDISNPLLAGVQERFWMQPNMVLALFAGLGVAAIERLLAGRVSKVWFT